ncbi:MAG: hypothetical protein Q9190_001957 [Brigantiaea leucoxantha]
MDAASTAAGWLSFVVTAVGLGSLITQTNAIEERLDPFHTSRSEEFLGNWISRQPKRSWSKLTKPTPVGPVISARLGDGFCGSNTIGVSRLSIGKTGNAGWTAILALFHELAPPPTPRLGRVSTAATKLHLGKQVDEEQNVPSEKLDFDLAFNLDLEKGSPKPPKSWTHLPAQPLTRNESSSCLVMSRATLIAILSLCNGRTMFRYNDASGHRSAYGSYCGTWYINWPLGQAAVVSFAPHDSHSVATDVYPPIFPVRVDKCIQMLAGVMTSSDSDTFKCAFPGRKPPGTWILQYQRKGFPGAHGSRHLYNMMGGKVFEVDFLLARRCETESQDSENLALVLPSLEKNTTLSLLVPKVEQGILEHCLDCLPWSWLSWSVHRGLRDILVAFAKPTMNNLRSALASALHSAAEENKSRLQAKGWAPEFVDVMADMASSSVLAGGGNSGDIVRVVTDVALLLWDASNDPRGLDETRFWRQERHRQAEPVEGKVQLSTDTVIALTKIFVLEWSVEFDYQMYHDLPPRILFA